MLDRTQTPEYKTMTGIYGKMVQRQESIYDILASSANEGNKISELVKADKR